MATIIINGQDYTLPEGEKLNAIQAAKLAGVDIPYYCWHPALSVVANCRMCEIEVGQKDAKTGEIKMVPKLVPGCQTPAKDGTVLVTDSAKVKEHQRMIMEYLLINHPLDCPVCDQAGMCGLQDYSYEYGQSNHRFVEERTVNPKKDVSDAIQLNQDRCIMCTRCVRFTREITQTGELQVMSRGKSRRDRHLPRPAGRQPPGRQRRRPLPRRRPARQGLPPQAARLVPLQARRHLHPMLDRLQRQGRGEPRPDLAVHPPTQPARQRLLDLRRGPGQLQVGQRRRPADLVLRPEERQLGSGPDRPGPQPGVARAGPGRRDGGKIAAVVSPFLTVEEAYLMAVYLKELGPENVLAIGPVPTSGGGPHLHARPDQGDDGRHQLRRPPAVHDPRREVPEPDGGSRPSWPISRGRSSFDGSVKRVESGEFAALYFTSDAIDAVRLEAEAKALRDGRQVPGGPGYAGHAAGPTRPTRCSRAGRSPRKAGCYVNADGRLQYAEAALPPRDGSLPDLDIFAVLMGRAGGPVRSRDVLAEMAGSIPAFSAPMAVSCPNSASC